MISYTYSVTSGSDRKGPYRQGSKTIAPQDKDNRDGRSDNQTHSGKTTPRRGTREARSEARARSGSGPSYSEEFAKAVGRTIKVLRTDLGMERRELADNVGISYSYLTEIENGNKPVSSRLLGPIAHALGLRVSQLAEAAELRLETWAEPELLSQAPSEQLMAAPPSVEPLRSYSSATDAQLAIQPSLRGPHRELRDTVLELERLLRHMAPDDIERLLDYARRLAR